MVLITIINEHGNAMQKNGFRSAQLEPKGSLESWVLTKKQGLIFL